MSAHLGLLIIHDLKPLHKSMHASLLLSIVIDAEKIPTKRQL